MPVSPARHRTSGSFNPHPTPGSDAMGVLPSGSLAEAVFQSSPDPWVGCNKEAGYEGPEDDPFQSSPDPWVGCNSSRNLPLSPTRSVSILTRPLGRMQWEAGPVEDYPDPLFQSSPDPWVGCNTHARSGCPGTPGFQSSPDPWVGCNLPPARRQPPPSSCFNPHPTPGSDAIRGPRSLPATGSSFNPHPTPGSDAI